LRHVQRKRRFLSESDFEGLLPAEVEAFMSFFGVATLVPISEWVMNV
jgi:hypothetical protein